MPTPPRAPTDPLARDVLRLVLYFDVFRHPLTVPELARLAAPGREGEVGAAADALEEAGLLARRGRYRLRPGGEQAIPRREDRARWAERIWPAARAAAGVLGRMPFVRGVLVTGGMSKNSSTPGGDVDFLLLVEPGRVWTLKSLLQGFRRALPEDARRLFCTNYLLDTDHLTIDDQNLFTAVELATAIPMSGPDACTALLDANPWAAAHIPGLPWSRARAARAPHLRAGPWRAALEDRWRGPTASWLEDTALSTWQTYWDRKYAWLEDGVRAQRFKRRQEIATNHLHDFQAYVLSEVRARLAEVGLDEDIGAATGPAEPEP